MPIKLLISTKIAQIILSMVIELIIFDIALNRNFSVF